MIPSRSLALLLLAAGPEPCGAEEAGGLSGPASVGSQLRQDEENRRPHDTLLDPARLKDSLEEDFGLNLGLDYNALWNHLSDSPADRDAVSGAVRFYGEWKPFHRDPETTGRLVFKVENRHRLGTDLAVSPLLPAAGVAGLSGPTFSDAGNILTNFYWTQSFCDNRYAVIFGIVDTTDYVDVYGLVNPWTDFGNLSFSTNPAIPAPSQGLGAAAYCRLTPNWYLLGGIADANGDPGDPGDAFGSFFEDGELFKHVEFGWIESFDSRFTDNIHVTVWQVDERSAAGVNDGWGVTFSASRLVGDRWLPFFRAGWADDGGALLERSVSAGIGCKINERGDYLAFGASWGRPDPATTGGSHRNQYTFETFYRWQVLPQFQIAPGFQWIVDPAYAPSESGLAVFSLRSRIVF